LVEIYCRHFVDNLVCSACFSPFCQTRDSISLEVVLANNGRAARCLPSATTPLDAPSTRGIPLCNR
jgi:hypothetical protein